MESLFGTTATLGFVIIKTLYILTAGKNNCKYWACGEVEHNANECKNGKNNKLIETLGNLDYVEFSEDEALDLALGNNK